MPDGPSLTSTADEGPVSVIGLPDVPAFCETNDPR